MGRSKQIFMGLAVALLMTVGTSARADGPMPWPGEMCQARASVIFVCTQVGYMQVQTLGFWGMTRNVTYFAGDESKCKEQAQALAQTRSTIYRPTIMAICSEIGYLSKYALAVDGSFQNLGNTFLETRENCLQQATVINAQP